MSHPKLGAIGVVIHQNQVLLVQRGKAPDQGLWGFPGGHVELGETALAAAAREVLEETGIQVTPSRYLTNLDVIQRAGDSTLHHYFLAAVVCDYQSGIVKAADDAVDARWVPLAQVETLAKSEGVDTVLKLATS